MKRLSLVAAFLLGINAILSQVILIRELLINFSGNELSMGIILAIWLIGGAIGSLAIARVFIDRVKISADIFAIMLSFISIIIPSMVFLSRTVRILFNIPIYEMIGPLQALFICGLLLLPLSCLLSICFVLCCKMLKEAAPKSNAAGIIYILEALGATSAGAIFTFFLVRHFSHFQVVLALIVINFIYILWLSVILKKRLYLAGLLISISALALICNIAGFLQKKSQTLQWHPQKVLAYVNSPYGNISVTRAGESFNLYENGSLFFTTQDEAFNEEFAHLVMLQHPEPKIVLLLGGGIGGVLKQVLKHNPERVTYLELDPLTIEIGKNFISDEDKAALTDNRVHIQHEDGRFFIKRTKEKFDIIIVNLPDPTTLQLNRFYTREFYRKARSHLKEGGILACRISSKEAIISDELARYNASVYKTLNSAFGFVSYIPGENLIFITSDNSQILEGRPHVLIERFKERMVRTRFLTSYHIKDKYYAHTLTYFKERLTQQYNIAKLNSDFHPICFYYDLILRGIQFQPGLVGLFNFITNVSLLNILAIILLFFIAGLFIIRTRNDPICYIVPSAIAVSGTVSIALEIIIILSFQISYGYVYGKVGFLIALFMLGLALGGYIMNKALARFKDHIMLLSYIILFFSIYTLSVPMIIKLVASMPSEAVQFVFYPMILATGVAVGSQFPVGVAILQKKRTQANSAALVWGADLSGATAGTLISSLVIIPVLGMFKTALLCSVLGGVIFLLLILSQYSLSNIKGIEESSRFKL